MFDFIEGKSSRTISTKLGNNKFERFTESTIVELSIVNNVFLKFEVKFDKLPYWEHINSYGSDVYEKGTEVVV